MQKAVLEGNILPKASQRFLIEGIGAGVIFLTRDQIEVSVGIIELPDQTRVPGGRKRSGEFTTTIQFGHDISRNSLFNWLKLGIDAANGRGIDPAYKRRGTVIYNRLFAGSPGTYNSGSDALPVKLQIEGLWCSQYNMPDFDMNADEGEDGFTTVEATLQFDDVDLVLQGAGA